MSHILCYLRIFIAHLVLLNLLLTNMTVHCHPKLNT